MKITKVKESLYDMLNFFLPSTCFLCGKRLDDFHAVLCPECEKKLKPDCTPFCVECEKHFEGEVKRCKCQSPLEFVYPLGDYKSGWNRLVIALKLQKKTAIASFLGEAIGNRIKSSKLFKGFDYLLPVPTHSVRKRERGFEQAALIAQVASRVCNLPILKGSLRRAKFKKSQIGLSKAQRRENVKGAFSVAKTELVENRNLIIIDDVVTTGSTLRSIAVVLKDAGCGRISAAVVARA